MHKPSMSQTYTNRFFNKEKGNNRVGRMMDYIGIEFKKCCECDNFIGEFDTIDYCDYKCTAARVIRLGLEEARKRNK